MLAYISGEAFLGQPIPPPLPLQAPDGSTDAPSEPSDENKEIMRKRMKSVACLACWLAWSTVN